MLQAAVPSAVVAATEVDERAVACARANGVDALVGDLDQPLPATFVGAVDVMTAVVPYVPTDELAFLPRDVVAFEPRHALDGGVGGLRLLTAVVALSPRWLRPGDGSSSSWAATRRRRWPRQMEAAGFVDIVVLRDDDGDDRAIEARRPAADTPPARRTIATSPPRRWCSCHLLVSRRPPGQR